VGDHNPAFCSQPIKELQFLLRRLHAATFRQHSTDGEAVSTEELALELEAYLACFPVDH
jgi:hypothetical protein